MKNNIGIFLLLGLMSCSFDLSAKKKLSGVEEVILSFSEMKHYLGSSVQFYVALQLLSQKDNISTPEITCKFCPKRSLPCDELIVKVQAKAMDKAIGTKESVANKAREKMLSIYREITQRLSIGSLNEIRKFMAKIAQEENIPCEDCQKVEWQASGVSK